MSTFSSSSSYLLTSESVTEGHPDKVCDQVSDAILDAMLAEDPESRVACETAITKGFCVCIGEVTTHADIDIQRTIRETIRKIGYISEELGFDADHALIQVYLKEQSAEINAAVGADMGAGDQGIMMGFACNETPELMPLTISLAHKLTKKLAEVRKDGTLKYLRPDGKSQVTIEYEGDKPKRVHTVVVSTQHAPTIGHDELKDEVVQHVIKPVVGEWIRGGEPIYHVNPTGRFVVGGPQGDAGLTGRKIIVDTYGGYARHGGGAFSGKDPSKVDRSGAYAARWVAKNVVAAGLARRCEVQVAYAIGVREPVSLLVDTFGTGTVPDAALEKAVREQFDLVPRAIIEALDLRKPIFKATAAYGHFGRKPAHAAVDGRDVELFTWERTDRAAELADTAKRLAGATKTANR